MRLLIILAAILIAVIFGIIWRDTHRFVTVTYDIVSSKIKRPITLAVLADLHDKDYGQNNAALVDAIHEMQPDMVLCAGDILTSGSVYHCEHGKKLMEDLAGEYPVCYVNGNHESRVAGRPGKYADSYRNYQEAIRSAGVRMLNNDRFFFEDLGTEIFGIELEKECYSKFNYKIPDLRDMREKLPLPTEGAYRILLAHNPEFLDTYADWGADLVLSGHIHGGIARLPLLGGVISPRYRLFPHYDGGRFERNGTVLLLSRGLGTHTLHVRFYNPGELLCVHLLPEKQET